MNPHQKLTILHERVTAKRESIVADVIIYNEIKKLFGVPKLTPLEYAMIKTMIVSYLRSRRHL